MVATDKEGHYWRALLLAEILGKAAKSFELFRALESSEIRLISQRLEVAAAENKIDFLPVSLFPQLEFLVHFVHFAMETADLCDNHFKTTRSNLLTRVNSFNYYFRSYF